MMNSDHEFADFLQILVTQMSRFNALIGHNVYFSDIQNASAAHAFE